MFVAISTFKVANGLSDEIEQSFVDRPHLVDGADGFVRMDVIRGLRDPDMFRLITYWRDEGSYQHWHRSDAHKQSHRGIPSGLKLQPGSVSLEFFHHVVS